MRCLTTIQRPLAMNQLFRLVVLALDVSDHGCPVVAVGAPIHTKVLGRAQSVSSSALASGLLLLSQVCITSIPVLNLYSKYPS